MRLQFVYEHGFGIFLSLLEILVYGRDGLSVGDLEVLELRIWMFLYLLAFHVAVVIYYQFSVRSHVYVEFAAPEAGFLSAAEGCH